ncbi:MAG TPA: phospholipase D-like domain-containing protein [Vicinamibacterales bacterium]|nr:phospholipase D-like domain-containing protein [Vicinamibacterales bacterium]
MAALLAGAAVLAPSPASAQESLCDNSFQDCRAQIVQLIRAETVGIDVSFWFMTDSTYSSEIINRWRAGIPVRVILDLRADANYPANATIRQALINAGIPIRHKTTTGINHWKMMLYAGQGKMHFSAANFANGSYNYTTKYTGYVDEAVYFTDDQAIVTSFMRKFDDLWTDTVNMQNLANISGALTRNYPTYTISPDLNFPPDQDYQDRVVAQLRQETTAVDAVMFRITSGKIPDELIRRVQAGIPVRLITDQNQYRNTTYFWDAYNVDRMHAAGVQVKWKDDASGQDMHQKSITMHSRAMTAFGSSNWTASSSDTQREHNYFSTKPWFVQWFVDQFNRKWNNLMAPVDGGGAISPPQFLDFVPGYPEPPLLNQPANGALGIGTSVTLRWEGGWWAHKYDIYFGTASNPPLVIQDFMPGSATAGVQSTKESFTMTSLQPGVTYYWRIVGKTMANMTRSSQVVYSFTTSGGGAIPPAPTGLTGTAVTSTRIDVSWTDVAGEEGYKIERKLSSATTWTQIATPAANVTTYQDTNSGLAAGTTYNYRVRAYTSAGNSSYSNTITVTTPTPTLSPTDVVLYASEAPVRVGAWSIVADATAAGGNRLNNPNAGAAVISTPLANPANYFEMTFTAPAGQGFRLWLRGKAYNDSGYNDSVHVQFSDSVNSSGSAVYRIGTTSGTYVNLAEASGETIQGWGWQDNGFGLNVLGPLIYFATSGTHTIRVQVREDGFSIDQIVLSADTFVNTAPGANKLDSTKLPRQNGAAAPPPSAAAARILADAYVRGGSYASTSFGAVSELIVKLSADAAYWREAFMKLDISALQSGQTVRLRLSGHLSDTRAASVTTNVYPVASTSWAETSLTWNNKPAAGTTSIGSVVVSGTGSQWYEIHITTYAQQQRTAGATTIAIALRNPADTLPYSAFASRESGSRPELVFGN